MIRHTETARRVALAAALLTTLALAAPHASAAEQSDDGHELEISFGGKGGLLLTGATEVPEQTPRKTPFEGQENDPELYGMFGATGGGGPVLDIRYKRVIGLETALYFTNDSAEGTNDLEDTDQNNIGSITQHQSTTALHIPLLLKASVPSENVRPVFGLGIEHVAQQSSSLEYTSDDDLDQRVASRNDHNDVQTSNYTLLQFTAGVEIDAGPLRIPIEMRAGYNLGWDDTFPARVDVPSDDRFVYNGEYIGHFGFFAGVLYRFGTDL